MKKIETVPFGYTELQNTYGFFCETNVDKKDDKFIYKNIKVFDLPFPMIYNGKEITKGGLHKKIYEPFIDALEEIKSYKGLQYLIDNQYNVIGDMFKARKKHNKENKTIIPQHRGMTWGLDIHNHWSTHAWGIAFDICPNHDETNFPDFIAEAFIKRNFLWGKYLENHNINHFQACIGY